jgi:hypothetical protein
VIRNGFLESGFTVNDEHARQLGDPAFVGCYYEPRETLKEVPLDFVLVFLCWAGAFGIVTVLSDWLDARIVFWAIPVLFSVPLLYLHERGKAEARRVAAYRDALAARVREGAFRST